MQLSLWQTQASTLAACSSATQTGRGTSWLICVHMQLVHTLTIFTRYILATCLDQAEHAPAELPLAVRP
jgi:hypothetical protein